MKKKILIGVLVFVILVGIFTFVFKDKFSKKEIENNETRKEVLNENGKDTEEVKDNENTENKEIILEKGMILFSREDFNKKQQDIFSVNIKNSNELKITSLDTLYNDIVYYKGKIYFLNKDGNLESFDLKNKKSQILDLGKTNNEDNKISRSKFIISDDKIFYISGECGLGVESKCSLGYYDVLNSNNKIIVDEENVLGQAESFNLNGYDNLRKTLRFSVGFGGIGGGASSFFDWDLNSNKIKFLGNAKYRACDGEFRECTDKIKKENDRYNELSMFKKIVCDGVDVDMGKIGYSKYVGCVE